MEIRGGVIAKQYGTSFLGDEIITVVMVVCIC